MNFRQWLNEMWFKHREECEKWNAKPCADAATYFATYKWWLKREFKHQSKNA